MEKGKFISLEGVEGVGKSTNISFMNEHLRAAGIEVVSTREPGGTGIAEKIRELLLSHNDESLCNDAELLLMFAARAQHIQQVIKPALDAGKWVVCDRFTDATYAYQGGGRDFSFENIGWLESFVQKGLKPDMTVLLDLPVAIGLARAAKRSDPDRFEKEQKSFFEKVRQVYLQRAADDQQRFRIVDASHSLERVQQDIAFNLDELIKR